MWDIVIGLETHVQLATHSKLFSSSSTDFGASANQHASFIDLALPGTLPMLNKAVLDASIRLGLAINATIHHKSVFDRKHYFYPDLTKGYQTSQFYMPIVTDGKLAYLFNNTWHTLDIVRAHLEEDAGKSLHEDIQGATGIDLNRAGVPLLEIVTEPHLTSPAQAVAYARALHTLVKWLGISDGNMQEGAFRCDANVSIKPKGATTLGTRCEIKNLNSFRFLEEAMNSEIQRQIELVEDGGTVIQQTRLYDPSSKTTHAMRSKEDAQDYRYFPCPDLLPVYLTKDDIDAVAKTMPTLPKAMFESLIAQGLSEYDAHIITQSIETTQHYQALTTHAIHPLPAKLVANWLGGEILAYLNKHGIELKALPISVDVLAELLHRLNQGEINHKMAKEIFHILCEDDAQTTPVSIQSIIESKGFTQISDSSALQTLITDVLNEYPKFVEEYHAGKEKAFNALVGQVMKASKGKANPQQVNELLQTALKR